MTELILMSHGGGKTEAHLPILLAIMSGRACYERSDGTRICLKCGGRMNVATDGCTPRTST
jgi:hypothetical protein